MGILKLH